MYIDEEGYLCIDENINQVKPNEDGTMNLVYREPKWVTHRYKVNKEGLFEEVKD